MRLVIDGKPQSHDVDGHCAKVRHATKAKARKALKTSRFGKAVHFCVWCKAWHVTSQR